MSASTYSAASRESVMAQINITPLVDVMLVLLVIFMISAPTLTRTMTMQLPVATPTAIKAPPPRLQLRIDASGGYALDGRALTEDGLRRELAGLVRRSPGAVVEIATSRDADYQAFAGALATVRASGVENVGFHR